jgi:hypothetical protein
MKSRCEIRIGPDGETILKRDGHDIANYWKGFAKIWKEIYRDYDGIALPNDVWEFLINEENHTLRILSRPEVVNFEISIEKAKRVIKKNWIPPNRVEGMQHLIERKELTTVAIGLYESKSNS